MLIRHSKSRILFTKGNIARPNSSMFTLKCTSVSLILMKMTV
jgi:hypothetical protein